MLLIETILSQPFIASPWVYFICCFTVVLITTLWMNQFSTRFYFQGTVQQKFSMFDLQFPATPAAIPHLMSGIESMPDKGAAVKKALRGNLYVDFLFMAGAYPAIFLLCMHIAQKMHGFGHFFFFYLGLLQAVSWLFDISENIYIFTKLKSKSESSYGVHKLYFSIVVIKWSLALTGTVCAIFALLYLWIVGHYDLGSLPYLLILVLEIIFFTLLSSRLKKSAAKK